MQVSPGEPCRRLTEAECPIIPYLRGVCTNLPSGLRRGGLYALSHLCYTTDSPSLAVASMSHPLGAYPQTNVATPPATSPQRGQETASVIRCYRPTERHLAPSSGSDGFSVSCLRFRSSSTLIKLAGSSSVWIRSGI
jgi:hypothetical protein